ncbi:SMP-30/gluconolactonase/LRE family protein [Tolypothrix sp. FACHB-123]|uniref:SMP-30/gluconolactonase/LRE family protein n=1 Tax=Tolypothrix sp. FACHB-123 TaxID=2692868 RepID=UPI00280ABB2B|nr:SMP-30/gluconolactonase/LRE family protein [Tolypothrix sp. FACHB-123]
MQKYSLPIVAWGFLVGILTLQQSNANSPSGLQTIMSNNAQLERLSSGFRFTEGPVWDRRGFLLFSDIPANTIYKWTPEGKIYIFRHPAGNANGNTIDRQGNLITAEHDRRLIRTQDDGTIISLAERYQGKRLNSPNDVVVKSDGSIYFTDPPYGINKEKEELGFYGIYRLSSDGNLTLLTKEMIRPNGLAFSPDEKKLYVSDSEKKHIQVFQVNSDGTLSNGQIFAELVSPKAKSVPDGIKVDVKGNVYIAASEGVIIFSPSGKLLGKIFVPEAVTNLAWGDQDYKTLYITASKSLYRIQLNIAGIQPGESALP